MVFLGDVLGFHREWAEDSNYIGSDKTYLLERATTTTRRKFIVLASENSSFMCFPELTTSCHQPFVYTRQKVVPQRYYGGSWTRGVTWLTVHNGGMHPDFRRALFLILMFEKRKIVFKLRLPDNFCRDKSKQKRLCCLSGTFYTHLFSGLKSPAVNLLMGNPSF